MSEVHSANGTWASEASRDSFVVKPFGDEDAQYLDLGEKRVTPLEQFTKLLSQQFFNLPNAPEIKEVNYVNLVKKGVFNINANKFGKVVLARQEYCITSSNILTLFKSICEAYQNCFVHLVYEPNGHCSIGASPELLLSSDARGTKSVSMAGTIIDGATDFSRKEKEEQAFVTQYITAQFEAIGIQPAINDQLIQNNDVHHLYSTIASEKQLSIDQAKELLSKLHPTPAVCGYPLGTSREFIQKHEGFNRSWYSGYIGVFGQTELHTYVNLRCAQLFKGKALLFAGAGITKDSDPKAEFVETQAKMDVMRRFL